MSATPLLQLDDLRVRFRTREGLVHAVNGLSLAMQPGEILGLVGESGCGKSASAQAIMRLIGDRSGEELSGSIRLDGDELLAKSEREMAAVRGGQVAMIFQDPMTSLNPVYSIGEQIAEALRLHGKARGRTAWRRAVELLDQVGIPDAAERARRYPHEFSGGMRQRVVIAIALSCEPRLLIADEPTTALDVTTQAQILDLLRRLREQTGAGILFITHDLAVVAELCDRVAVMYAGELVECAPAGELFASPRHPYTQGLLASIPRRGGKDRLETIEGRPPSLYAPSPGCAFAPRCPHAMPACARHPRLETVGTGHEAACWLVAGPAPTEEDP